MKKIILFGVISLFFLTHTTCLAVTPHQIAGFILGNSIEDYKDRIKMETVLPIRYCGYLKEVEIRDPNGFKSGLIWYGSCSATHRIVRIKIKYADSSRKFYKALLNRFEDRFGKPIEWRGDPAHIFEAWKWSFIDTDNNRISLTLQHNTKDPERKLGNCVKLTDWNLLDEERCLFERKHPELCRKERKQAVRFEDYVPSDWDRFVPR